MKAKILINCVMGGISKKEGIAKTLELIRQKELEVGGVVTRKSMSDIYGQVGFGMTAQQLPIIARQWLKQGVGGSSHQSGMSSIKRK